MTVLRLDLNTVRTREDLHRYRQNMRDLRGPFKSFRAFLGSEIEEMFDKIPNEGGSARGVSWRGFADQYTRRDGTVVPAEGGVPKVVFSGPDGKGRVMGSRSRTVLGRKRHSRTRVKTTSKLMMDHGTMALGAVSRGKTRKTRMEMRPSVTRAVYQNRKRPFMFFTDKDVNQLRHFIINHVERHNVS